MKVVNSSIGKRLSISKDEWTRIGQQGNWLFKDQDPEEETSFQDIPFDMETGEFYRNGVFLEWAEKQQALRAFRGQGAQGYVDTISKHPKDFTLIYSFDKALLAKIYNIIEQKKESINADPPQTSAVPVQ